MRGALVGQEEARAAPRRRGTRVERGADVGGVGDPAGGEHRPAARRLQDARQRARERLGGEQVPAGLEPLRDERVGAVGDRAPCLLGRADLVEHDDPGRAQLADGVAVEAEEQRDRGDARLDAGAHVRAAGEREQEVRADRTAVGQLARPPQLGGERRGIEDPDRSQPARAGHGPGEGGAGDPAAHPGLDDRMFEAEPVEQVHGRR
jgi:hypothetical protein